MFHPSLDEKKKLEIAKLYQYIGIPVEEIAEKVGVSLRTVYNYKNYGYESDEDPTSSQTPEVKTEISQPKKGISYNFEKHCWECQSCGYTSSDKFLLCPKCNDVQTGNDNVDFTKDFWVCKECDHISNTEFDICPECGCKEIIFAPNGIEPRDPDDYTDSNDDISDDEIEANAEHSDQVEEPEKEESEEEDEEGSEEEEYECGKCGAVFDTLVEYCPKCGYGPLDWEGS